MGTRRTVLPWIKRACKMNPGYCGWSPGGDYMIGSGWAENAVFASWGDFRDAYGMPNYLNEFVSFQFVFCGANDPEDALADAGSDIGDRREIFATATVELQLWVIHPRKGASKGITVNNITEVDIPAVVTFLKLAAASNAKRFAKVRW